MKKVLTILAVALLSTATVFAAINFTGSVTAGFAFNFDNAGFHTYLYGDDGDDTETGSVKLNVTDEAGIWKATFEGELGIDGSGKAAADLELDLAKLIEETADYSIKVAFLANDRSTPSRAYVNKSGKSWDRIRTNDGGYFLQVSGGYGGFLTASVAWAPELPQQTNDKGDVTFAGYAGDLTAGVLVTPIDGVKVSAAYAMKGDGNGHGVIGGAADVDVGKFVDLDFTLGVSVADRYYFQQGNDLAVTVYGGFDLFDAAIEYAFTKANEHYLYTGADLKLVEGLDINVYVGASNLAQFIDTFFVGGSVGYKVSGITFKLLAEYAAKAGAKEFDHAGFTVCPAISVSF